MAKLTRDEIIQILEDAGCTTAFIDEYLETLDEGTTKEQLRLLIGQRCRQLECVHTEQKRLDCIDYLRYHLQKEQEQKKK